MVRHLLRRDAVWSAYALGDLDPRRAGFCEWYVRGESVALLYREFDEPILFAMGDPAVLDLVPYEGPCHLQLPASPPDFLPPQRFSIDWERSMRRMGLADPSAIRSAAASLHAAEPLTVANEAEIRELYSDGVATKEDPDFFMRSQLEDGTFFGVRDPDTGRLAAAGGTHLYSEPESVAAIGNVYTRRSHRGRGFARTVTAAIAARLLDSGIATIALNVKSQNAAAIRVYEQLGFRFHCQYREGFGRIMKKL